ncbi:MAG TPA: OmpA family protein, partial [Terriglobales bacterium]|nr:OmpA family protein [Terriglobales bacterium]
MNRAVIAASAALSLLLATGCSSKNYVRNQTTPLIDKTNELDTLTAQTTNGIKDLDARATKGIQDVNDRAAAANQKALAAGQQADQAQASATQASAGASTLTNQVANLDNYHVVTQASVHFGFDKADLTKKAKETLDQLATDVPNTPHYIVEVDGGADSVGSKDYNYGLSRRRADAVIQYLSQEHQIPAHKIYVIGLGKDKPVASNSSASGRAKNRRV